jgi:hypothetical protein
MYAKCKVVSYMPICLGKVSRHVITIMYMPNSHKYIGKPFIQTNNIILKINQWELILEVPFF